MLLTIFVIAIIGLGFLIGGSVALVSILASPLAIPIESFILSCVLGFHFESFGIFCISCIIFFFTAKTNLVKTIMVTFWIGFGMYIGLELSREFGNWYDDIFIIPLFTLIFGGAAYIGHFNPFNENNYDENNDRHLVESYMGINK